MILEVVGVLGPGLTSSSEEKEGLGDAFLESLAAEMLIQEHLTVRRAQECPLGWMYLPALELAQEIRLSESGDSQALVEIAWGQKDEYW